MVNEVRKIMHNLEGTFKYEYINVTEKNFDSKIHIFSGVVLDLTNQDELGAYFNRIIFCDFIKLPASIL